MQRPDATKEGFWHSKGCWGFHPAAGEGSGDTAASPQGFAVGSIPSGAELQVHTCGDSCSLPSRSSTGSICTGEAPVGLIQGKVPQWLLCISCRCCRNFVVVQFDIRLPAASERGTLSQLMFPGKHGTDSIHGTKDYYHLHGD